MKKLRHCTQVNTTLFKVQVYSVVSFFNSLYVNKRDKFIRLEAVHPVILRPFCNLETDRMTPLGDVSPVMGPLRLSRTRGDTFRYPCHSRYGTSHA